MSGDHSHRTSVSATILDGPAPDQIAHQTRFERLTIGEARWHWAENPEGEYLIGLHTVSEKRNCALGETLSEGVELYVITHSLGARVALTALNLLGNIGYRDPVDHLFLWQPAVADNALTNQASRDVHPLGLGVFPDAHTAARRIVVLHSKGDGILGSEEASDEGWWGRLVRRVSPLATAAHTAGPPRPPGQYQPELGAGLHSASEKAGAERMAA